MNDGEPRGHGLRGESQASCLVYALIGALVLAVFTGAILIIFTVAESDRAAKSEAAFRKLKERYQALAQRADARIRRDAAERQTQQILDGDRLRAALKKLEAAGLNDHPALAAAADEAREVAMAFGAGFAMETAISLVLSDGRIDADEAAFLLAELEKRRGRPGD